ncbi:ferritin-like domain-containing protein [Polyangium mundeleinium]|uniref:Ferritin-like domain-containing protein n=1 Tax=Polyangium mundeleinium TaxID=2995306 RepID=A0ABT5EX31_9BACT|nr:ferritin-like domain-containing protein [Polyangium mundeleinium]MDC0746368.1 ferritin-like domain-containing protein [Polyangium mundeleinium]
MFDTSRLTRFLPPRMQSQIDAYFEAFEVLLSVKDPKVLGALGPSGVRGLLLHRGKQGTPTDMPATHTAHFDWTYPSDQPEMADLYRRAKLGQWNGDDLPWNTSVDPLNPEIPIIPEEFLSFDDIEDLGIKLDKNERLKLSYSMCAWMLSQFLHGEQGALFAAAQVTEAVQFFDGKLYGATQVMDEGRHVEVFNRYLDTKLNKLYQINDNLFVIIDSLMTDGRWDMKFLGMQIMVEGLALGAFSTLYKQTKEPLLKELLKMVIQDEARHVHYGVCALREHFTKHLTERERQEREDWAFEVALLMRNRFAAYEVYEEWFEGRMTRAEWRNVVYRSKGMEEFRTVMFSRLVPNLREIGLLSPRIMPRYEEVGLMRYFGGLAADQLTAEKLLSDLH